MREWTSMLVLRGCRLGCFRREEVNLGGRFSKSSSERERILYRRKETMIQKARKRYIERQKQKAGQQS